MSLRKTAFLALILVVLGSYFYFYEYDVPEKKVEEFKKVFSFAPEEVYELRIKVEDRTTIFTKEGDKWNINQPQEAEGDNKKIFDMLTDISQTVDIQTIAENPADLSEYGLEKPEVECTIKITNNPSPITLLIGDKNPPASSFYATFKDSPRVFLVGTALMWVLDREVSYFSKKTKSSN